ncbi:Dabb family protein [Robiginitalea sp.]|uniref:Dabb family protein n=1 Tax=Robiginitalea sp. TaxID=1902411 RepID=UPI003C6AECD5
MKTAVLCFFLSCITASQAQIADLYKMPDSIEKPGVLRHVVLFKFKADTPGGTLRKIEKAFYSLPEKIPEIADFEWGLNNSPEGINKGFTHCFVLTFSSEEDRAVYLPHPDHKRFGEILDPWLEDVLVVDYWMHSGSE